MKASFTTLVIVTCLGLMNLRVPNDHRYVELQKDLPQGIGSSRSLGPLPANRILHLAISLPYGDPIGIQDFVDRVSDPIDPSYRKYLSPEQVGARFGVSQDRVNRVSQFLEDQGMKIRTVAKNRLAILVDATVEQAEIAFHTRIKQFEYEGHGTRFSFTHAPSIPVDLAPDILDISGLEDFSRSAPQDFAVGADQLQTLYGASAIVNNSNLGEGRTIGITSRVPFRLSDVAMLISFLGLPVPDAGPLSNIHVVEVDGAEGETNREIDGEAALDIQCVLAMAPKSNIVVYDYPSSYSHVDVLSQEVSDNACDIITESYSNPIEASERLAAHNLHLSMSAQGITYMASSGDTGPSNQVGDQLFCYPQIDPEVLMVGGTQIYLNPNNTRLNEVGYNDPGLKNGLAVTGGGGWIPTTDTFNIRPTYQRSSLFSTQPGVASLGESQYRLYPDLSMDASVNGGHLFYYGGVLRAGSGTSAASPTFAGLLAIAEQQLIGDRLLLPDPYGHYRLGRIQDLLYTWGTDPSIFYDVTSGTNGILPNGKQSFAISGWDTDTGWGALKFDGFLAKFEHKPLALTAYPATLIGSQSTQATVTVPVAAPIGGYIIQLSSSDQSVAQVPSSVRIPAGKRSAGFVITSASAGTPRTLTIQATRKNWRANLALKVAPLGLDFIYPSGTPLIGGSQGMGQVTLTGPAPIEGAPVTLSLDGPGTSVASPVIIPSGQSSATFTYNTGAANEFYNEVLHASYGGRSIQTKVTSYGFLLEITGGNPPYFGGTTLTGKIELSIPAPTGGRTFTITSSNDGIAKPFVTILTIPQGQSEKSFSIQTFPQSVVAEPIISVEDSSLTVSRGLEIDPPILQSLSLPSNSLKGGQSVTGSLTLSAPAPNGFIARLSSSDAVVIVPTQTSLSTTQVTTEFQISTAKVKRAKTATVSVFLNGISLSQTVTISP